jgi:hypothetical protein
LALAAGAVVPGRLLNASMAATIATTATTAIAIHTHGQ